jgi:hypothetical protein
MYEVHYDDGADHAGVGTFETYKAARRFADLVRSCGYEAVVKDLAYPSLLDEDFDAFDRMSNEYHQAKYAE